MSKGAPRPAPILRRRFAAQLRLAAMAGVAVSVAACSVADSFHVDPAAIQASGYTPGVPTLCQSTLGSYALPKSHLKVMVTRAGEEAPVLTVLDPVVTADKSLTFCLDHLIDPLADDHIRIIKSSGQADSLYQDVTKRTPTQFGGDGQKDYGTQLLHWVVSNTVNQAEYIARVLVRAAFVGISGKSNFTPLQRSGRADGPVPVAVLEYDPFDPEKSAMHNQRLRDLGYCLVLENFTFDTSQMTAEQYCSAPRYTPSAFDEAYTRYRSGPPPRIAGIAYRPRISYALSIYKNDNPKGRGGWRLASQQRVAMENIAPIVSIGLTRSIFAARRVALKFDRGTLQAMCLVKTSELQSAVLVPYEIAKSIVALPTEIFEVKIGNITDNSALLDAERRVVDAQKTYLTALTDVSMKSFKNTAQKPPDPTIPNPIAPLAPATPTATSILPSSVANMNNLESTVLDQICRNAPSIIEPGARKTGGRP